MLIKELWLGPEKAYACRISKQAFGADEYGGSEAARRAALHCACEIVREQTRNGVPAGTSIRQRRKLYHTSEANRLHHAAVLCSNKGE
jgi:hypothetical protein